MCSAKYARKIFKSYITIQYILLKKSCIVTIQSRFYYYTMSEENNNMSCPIYCLYIASLPTEQKAIDKCMISAHQYSTILLQRLTSYGQIKCSLSCYVMIIFYALQQIMSICLEPCAWMSEYWQLWQAYWGHLKPVINTS